MKLDIINKKENALLGRTEIEAKLSFEGATPKRAETIKALASAMKTKPQLVVVRSIETHYGGLSADVSACIYSDEKKLELYEREYMRNRNKIEEPAPAEEEPAKEKTEEKPADEVKEKPAGETDNEPAEEKTDDKPTKDDTKTDEKPTDKKADNNESKEKAE